MSVLTVGSRGASVRQLQERLRAAGFDPGGADGVYGARTRRAVSQFQRAQGLDVDGKVGVNTTRALQRRRNTDAFEPARPASRTSTRTTTPRAPAPRTTETREPAPRGRAGRNLTATFDRVTNAGRRNQLVTGRITVNGRAYDFRSGGHARGSLPPGDYAITPHLWSRSNRSMTVGGVGYSFAMSDKYDSRVGGTRRLLRIHPDGAGPGTEGCIGIVGNAAVQRQFREDMRAELARNGGRFTLRVG